MKPWTPRNGTELQLIRGIWTTRNLIPAFEIRSAFHGPVIQNAAFLLRNALDAAPSSTLALTRPALFHESICFAFRRKRGLSRPMSDGSRLPARFVPNT
jgi:hypothetical protein